MFWPFGIIGLILSQFENRVQLKSVAGVGWGWVGVWGGKAQCWTIILLCINRHNKTESAIFIPLMCSLLPKDLHSELIVAFSINILLIA